MNLLFLIHKTRGVITSETGFAQAGAVYNHQPSSGVVRRCASGFNDDIMFSLYNRPYSGVTFATKDRFRLSLLLYRKIEQNSISYY